MNANGAQFKDSNSILITLHLTIMFRGLTEVLHGGSILLLTRRQQVYHEVFIQIVRSESYYANQGEVPD